VNTANDRVVRHSFTGLTIRAKMVRGGRPLLRGNLTETGQPLQKRLFPINIRS